MSQTQKSWFGAVVICLLAFWLAAYDLEHRSMWYDEWLSWNWSQMSLPVMAQDTALQGGHPPTYYAFLWLWTRLTMTQQLSVMRLSSVFFGVMIVAMTYRLAMTWFKSDVVALVASLTVATSSIFIYFMRELRMYTLMTLLVAVSWWAFERLVHHKRNGMLLYGLTLAVMAYTYYFTVFMALLQFVMALVFYRRALLRLFIVYVCVGVMLLPWLPSLLIQVRNDAQYASYGIEVPGVGVVAKGAATKETNWNNVQAFIRSYTNSQPHLIVGAVALGVVIGALHYWRDVALRRRYIAVVLWGIGTVFVFFIGNFFTPLYKSRYLLMIMPALGMLIGFGFVELPRRYQWVLATGLLVFGVWTHTGSFFDPDTPHDKLLGTVAANFEEGDRIWYNLESGAQGSSLYSAPEYYLTVKYTDLTMDDFVWDAPETLGNVERIPRIWDVRDIFTPVPDYIHTLMLDGRRVTETHEIGVYSVRLYEAPPQQNPVQFEDVFGVWVNPLESGPFVSGESFAAEIWFDVNEPPVLDYSLALHLRTAEGEVVAQSDVPLVYQDPFEDEIQLPTSQWEPDTTPYVVFSELALPDDLPSGEYGLWLTVYHWQNSPEGLPVEDNDAVGNFISVAEIIVQ